MSFFMAAPGLGFRLAAGFSRRVFPELRLGPGDSWGGTSRDGRKLRRDRASGRWCHGDGRRIGRCYRGNSLEFLLLRWAAPQGGLAPLFLVVGGNCRTAHE